MKRKVKKFGSGGETDSPDFSRLSFKEAFQAARGGPNAKEPMNKTFTWNGKKYSTSVASGKADKKSETKTETKYEDTNAKIGSQSFEPPKKTASRPADEPGLEGVHPEALLPIGRVLKGISTAASLSKRGKEVEKPVRREPTMESKAEIARRPRDVEESRFADEGNPNFKRGGKVKKMAKGGSASSRADGCAMRGKTKGRIY